MNAQIEFPVFAGDAPDFIDRISQIVEDEVRACVPEEIYLVRIDHAFDRKWLAYSGNLCKHVPSWQMPLTLPPFHPSRVTTQRHLVRGTSDPVNYVVEDSGKALHLRQRSSENLDRSLADVSASGLFIWYSGETEISGRGTLMIYYNLPTISDGWIATFRKENGWQMLKHRTISGAAHQD